MKNLMGLKLNSKVKKKEFSDMLCKAVQFNSVLFMPNHNKCPINALQSYSVIQAT